MSDKEQKIVPFNDQLNALQKFEIGINLLGCDEPQKAYLVGIELGKISDRVKKSHSDAFKKYYDVQKELPGWFECKVSNRKSYAFEENPEWVAKKAELDAIEEKLKTASEHYSKNNSYMVDAETGEIYPTVSVKWSEVYSVTRK